MAKKPSPSRDTVTSLFSSFAGQGGTLVIPRPYIDFCKRDHLAALFLSQCLYWSDRTRDKDGWFSKSFEEWDAELGMSTFQVRRAVKVLAAYGLEVKKRRSSVHGGAPTLHYRVNKTVIAQRISEFLGLVSSSLMEETHYSDQRETHYSYTETTQRLETTFAASDEARADTALAGEDSSSVKANGGTKDATDALPLQSSAKGSPSRARSAAQLANDAMVDTLRWAWFEGRKLPIQELGPTDYGLYLKRAKELRDGGIGSADVKAYVEYWHAASVAGGWTLTLNSLVSNGRMADYKAFKARPVSAPASTAPAQTRRYNPADDPAYARREGETK